MRPRRGELRHARRLHDELVGDDDGKTGLVANRIDAGSMTRTILLMFPCQGLLN
jgi:hypothetical protein